MCLPSKEISVVIQGTVNSATITALQSIRKYLPEAEIIFSTWESTILNESITHYTDKIIFNKDPGAGVFDLSNHKLNNLNRLIISSQSGISQASRSYVLKIRSDIILRSNAILSIIDPYKKRDKTKSLFEKRIIVCDTFSLKIDCRRFYQMRLLFHISDWLYFGLKRDLAELFNIPLIDEIDFTNYYKNHQKSSNDIFPERTWKMSPEQYITSSNARKIIPDILFCEYSKFSDRDIYFSELFTINNFYVVSLETIGAYIEKDIYKGIKMNRLFLPHMYYSVSEQDKDYKKYICNSSTLPTNNSSIYKIYPVSAKPLFHRILNNYKNKFDFSRILLLAFCVPLIFIENTINFLLRITHAYFRFFKQ